MLARKVLRRSSIVVALASAASVAIALCVAVTLWAVGTLAPSQNLEEPAWPETVESVHTTLQRPWLDFDARSTVGVEVALTSWDASALRSIVEYALMSEDPYAESISLQLNVRYGSGAHWDCEYALPLDLDEIPSAAP